jgi:hypothetical protein
MAPQVVSTPRGFVQIPAGMLDDPRLLPIDLLVYGILRAVDVDRDGVSLISLQRIGKRVRRDERAAQRGIERLEAAGWLQTIDNGVGNCRSYRLSTPTIREQGTLTIGEQGGDAEPPPLVTGTPTTGEHQPIRKSKLRTYVGKEGDEDNETRRTLVELLKRNGFNGEATEKAQSLLEKFARPDERQRLTAWLDYALTPNGKGIHDPVGCAYSRTRDGENPPRPKTSRYPPLDDDGNPISTSPYQFFKADADGNPIQIPAKNQHVA